MVLVCGKTAAAAGDTTATAAAAATATSAVSRVAPCDTLCAFEVSFTNMLVANLRMAAEQVLRRVRLCVPGACQFNLAHI